MAYGIEVLNINGGTVFNSTHYVEMGAYTGTVNAGAKFDIPDWCFGLDQRVVVANRIHTRKHTGVSYSNVNEIAIMFQDTSGFTRVYDTPSTINYNNATIVSRGNIQGANGSNYTNAWHVYTMSEDMSGIRTTSGTSTIGQTEFSTYNPSIYVRPTSSSYSGKFWSELRQHATTDSGFDSSDALNTYLTIHDSVSGTNQFEVMVALPANVWGGVSGTKAHTAGTDNYGLQSLSTTGQKHTPNGPSVQFTAFDSRGRPSKIFLTKKVALPTKTVTNVSMGSLVTSSTKRWCRMNGTEFFLVDNSNYPTYGFWHWMYQWNSNNSISLTFNKDVLTSYSTTDFTNSLTSDTFFAVANFGLGL